MARTVVSAQVVRVRWVFRFGSAADGQGISASFSARVFRGGWVFRSGPAAAGRGTSASSSARLTRATLSRATRWTKIQITIGAVSGPVPSDGPADPRWRAFGWDVGPRPPADTHRVG